MASNEKTGLFRTTETCVSCTKQSQASVASAARPLGDWQERYSVAHTVTRFSSWGFVSRFHRTSQPRQGPKVCSMSASCFLAGARFQQHPTVLELTKLIANMSYRGFCHYAHMNNLTTKATAIFIQPLGQMADVNGTVLSPATGP